MNMKRPELLDIENYPKRRSKNDSLGWGVASSVVALSFSLFVINHQSKLKKLGFADQKTPLNLYQKKVAKSEYDKVLSRLEQTQNMLNSVKANNARMRAKIVSYKMNEKSSLVYMNQYQDQVNVSNEWKKKYEMRTKNFDHIVQDYTELKAEMLETIHTGEENAALITEIEKLKSQNTRLKAETSLAMHLYNDGKAYESESEFATPSRVIIPSVATFRIIKDVNNQTLNSWKYWRAESQVVRKPFYVIPLPVEKVAKVEKVEKVETPVVKKVKVTVKTVTRKPASVLADENQMKEWKEFVVNQERKKYAQMRAVFNTPKKVEVPKVVKVEKVEVDTPSVIETNQNRITKWKEFVLEDDVVRAPASADIVENPVEEVKYSATGETKVHIVEVGHTLTGISLRYYKDAAHWQRLLTANPDLDPAKMEVGQEVIIPVYEKIESKVAEVIVPPKAKEVIKVKAIVKKVIKPVVTEVESSSPVNEVQDYNDGSKTIKIHIIQKGESLMTISKKYYNTHQKFNLILGANPELDAMTMKPGHSVQVPNIEKEKVIWVNGKMKPANGRKISSED
ncbi:MAG: LysM peptidoglycan-binding domain-containing protein [Bacteriovoracaceae bacterium]|nr:LysM peptidoglycan-binding domain-containing protein [Bacteriovoracaceae bacterium]